VSIVFAYTSPVTLEYVALPSAEPSFETRHLAALRAVAEEGSFRGAAAVLGYSQAAISQQISALEARAGVTLFTRPGGPKPVALTPAGRVLLRHAAAVLDRLDQARRDLDDLASGTAGRLTVGTFQSVSVELLPKIVGRVRLESPNLQMRAVEEEDNLPLQQGIHDGELDVSFLAGPVSDTGIDLIELGIDPFVAVLPRTPEFESRSSFTADAAVATGLVGEHRGNTRTHIEQSLRARGLTPRYVFRTDDNGAMQAMVRNGMGAAIMPQLAVDASDPGIVVLPLDPPLPPRSIVLGLPKPGLRAPAAERFAEIAREVGQQRLQPPASGVSL